jgi:hypothetical protein
MCSAVTDRPSSRRSSEAALVQPSRGGTVQEMFLFETGRKRGEAFLELGDGGLGDATDADGAVQLGVDVGVTVSVGVGGGV